jgi:L-arabinose transport system permease protein
MQIVRGFTYRISNGQSVGVSNASFTVLGSYFPRLATVRSLHLPDWLSLPIPVWLCLAFFLVFGFLLDRTLFGRNTLAVGGNEEASRLAGIPVVRTKVLIFLLQGLVASFAGIVLASRMTSGQPKVAEGFELEVIAACVLGGVSLTGGIGKMSFVVAGVLIMGVVQNAMSLKNINFDWQYIVRGSILMAAVLFDRFKQRTAGS